MITGADAGSFAGSIAVGPAIASAGLYLVLLAFKAFFALRYARDYPAPPADIDLSAATIVQPILSGDPRLGETLAANLATLPEARFLWLIDADDPQADALAAALQATHPAHRIERCLCPPAPAGINPKLFKLERARALVTRGAFVVLDDDTRLTRVGLGALLAGLERHTLTTGLPCYDEGGTLPARLLAQFVNNNAALTYLPLLAFAPPPTINGMAYAIAPASLTAIGGFEPLWRHLADDLAVARRVRQVGGTIVQTPYPHAIATSVRDLRHYRALMHRWFLFALLLLRDQSSEAPPHTAESKATAGGLRFASLRPVCFASLRSADISKGRRKLLHSSRRSALEMSRWKLLIGLLHGLPPVLLWIVLLGAAFEAIAWIAGAFGGPPILARPPTLTLPTTTAMMMAIAGALLGGRAATLIVVQRRVTGRGRHAPLLSIVAELLQPLHLAHAWYDPRIVWRTRRYRVRANDDFGPDDGPGDVA